MKLRPANDLTWDNYRWAFRTCSRWLASWFVPWRWFVNFHQTLVDLRHLDYSDTGSPRSTR